MSPICEVAKIYPLTPHDIFYLAELPFPRVPNYDFFSSKLPHTQRVLTAASTINHDSPKQASDGCFFYQTSVDFTLGRAGQTTPEPGALCACVCVCWGGSHPAVPSPGDVGQPLHGEAGPLERVCHHQVVEERRVLLPDPVLLADDALLHRVLQRCHEGGRGARG